MNAFLSKEDYEEPRCLLDMHPNVTPIPVGRVMEKLDFYLGRNDYDASEKHLKYWLSEADAGYDMRGKLTVLNVMQSVAEKLQSLWNEALTDAGRAYQNAKIEAGDGNAAYSGRDERYADYAKPITVADIQKLREIIKAHSGNRVSINDFTSEDIQKAQKWAYKFYNELGTKSPFFRAWFGDWRAYDISSYYIVHSSGNRYNGAGTAINSDTGKKISWGDTVKGETYIHAVKEKISVQALGDIGNIIENAILFDTDTSGKTSKSKMENTAFMHNFYSVYKQNNDVYLLKLYVEEALPNKGGDPFARAYQLKDIEKIAELPNGVLLKNEGLTEDNSTIVNSVADLYALVKTYDKDFHAGNKVSPYLLNEDGTPKTFYHGTDADFSVINTNTEYNLPLFTTTDRYSAGTFGKKTIGFYGRAENILVKNNNGKAMHTVFYNYKGSRMSANGLLKMAKADGYDAVVFRNAKDSADGTGKAADIYAFMKPETQLKSAADNIGTFDSSNPDIRYSSRITAEEDAEYLELAKNPTKNEAHLRTLVEKAARENGYDSPILYHGTDSFGFKAFDRMRLDDRRSIFLTSSQRIASTYSGVEGNRRISDMADIPADISPVILASELNVSMPDYEKDANYRYISFTKETFDNLVEDNKIRLAELQTYLYIGALVRTDLSDSERKNIETINDIIRKGYNPSETSISTPLWFLLQHEIFPKEETANVRLLESNIRLANLLNERISAGNNDTIAKVGLDGYDVEVFTIDEAKKILEMNSGKGNYALYLNQGKTVEVNCRGRYWNRINYKADITRFYTVISGSHGHRIYNTFTNETLYIADTESGEYDDIGKAFDKIKEIVKEKPVEMSYTYLQKTRDISKWADLSGYNSVTFRDIADNGGANPNISNEETSDIYIAFSPSQVKSADLVTYDDNGNVIPLSERFNEKNEDIRYSGRGNGYDGYSMPNNARDAYANGEKPWSKWSKSELLKAAATVNPAMYESAKKMSLEDLKKSTLARTAWHHTSKYYNKTQFYEISEQKINQIGYHMDIDVASDKYRRANGDFEVWFSDENASYNKEKRKWEYSGNPIPLYEKIENEDIRYSSRENIADMSKLFETISDEEYEKNKLEHPFVLVMNHTPQIIIDSTKDENGIGRGRDRKILIIKDALYLAIRENGIQEGHYHGLGSNVLSNLPKYLESPDAILETDGNSKRRLVLASIESEKANAMLSVEFESMKDYEGDNDYYNIVITVFDLHENYLKNLFKKHNAVIKAEKENLVQVNPQLYEWLRTFNTRNSTVIDTTLSPESQEEIIRQNDENSMNSLRNPEASNRELLANALESTVTNETDAKYLADYKANIEKLNAEEAKLKDLFGRIIKSLV